MEIPFKVLNTFRRGVILQSVPEGMILKLEPGDVIHITHFPNARALDTRDGVREREALARDLPDDTGAAADWRHSTAARRSR